MADKVSNSLVNLDALAEPANTLIKKISRAVGGLCRPWQMKRVALAESEANTIRAQNDLDVASLRVRAVHRLIEEESQHQKNMEAIAVRAVEQVKKSAQPEHMDDDWIANFFSNARIVSDESMRCLWARVLAGEANRPGSYSKRTVNWLADVDKRDAEQFAILCSFGCSIGGALHPLIYDVKAPVYSDQGVSFGMLTHLSNIGLIRFEALAGFSVIGMRGRSIIRFQNESLVLEIPGDGDHSFSVGSVLLSQVGSELAQICDPRPIGGFVEYLKDRWAGYLCGEPG
jgi:hypothetical protein